MAGDRGYLGFGAARFRKARTSGATKVMYLQVFAPDMEQRLAGKLAEVVVRRRPAVRQGDNVNAPRCPLCVVKRGSQIVMAEDRHRGACLALRQGDVFAVVGAPPQTENQNQLKNPASAHP